MSPVRAVRKAKFCVRHKCLSGFIYMSSVHVFVGGMMDTPDPPGLFLTLVLQIRSNDLCTVHPTTLGLPSMKKKQSTLILRSESVGNW